MLEELYVNNVALIDNLKIDFKPGFNILTGESGSGKSLIAGAISLLKGNKGDSGIIRTGADSAEVSGIFTINSDLELAKWLEAKGITPEENSLIIRRTLKSNGRGTITVQSVPLVRNELVELSSFLFDIHGQHEQHTLISEDKQRILLDNYSGISEDVVLFSSLFDILSKLKKKLSEHELSEKERLREIDILKFVISEISEAKLVPGEDEKIEKEHKILLEHEKLFKFVDEAHEQLAGSGSQTGLLLKLKTALNSLNSAALIDESLGNFSERMSNSFFDLEDISESLRDYKFKNSYSPEKLQLYEERLSVIYKLKKKYGGTLNDVIKYLEDSIERLSELENFDANREELKAEIKKKEEEVVKKASELSEKRVKNGAVLEKEIEEVLKSLGMPNVQFKVSVQIRKNESNKPVYTPYGFDKIEFLISPNTGEPLKPIEQIASGGELSRIMLAIKSVLSNNDPVDSMLFDEIDSGIGGEIAVSLGYHLQKLSTAKQIICITHLASIAVNADNHIRVRKIIENQRTFTRADKVENNDRVAEVARMLAGDQKGDVSLEHARVMLSKKF
ncbi:MAG: DNA repair protein RecN [Spirochaetes bacterium]|nr:DNA repair protein RecN [Spirochaetota bacterium]